MSGDREVGRFDLGAKGEVVVLESQPSYPPEVFAVKTPGAELRRLTHVNDDVLAGIRLGKVDRLSAKSPDGTPIDGFLTRPPEAKPGEKVPTLLRIHGGPVSQFSNEFSFEWQLIL